MPPDDGCVQQITKETGFSSVHTVEMYRFAQLYVAKISCAFFEKPTSTYQARPGAGSTATEVYNHGHTPRESLIRGPHKLIQW